jgi:hypothetical protein
MDLNPGQQRLVFVVVVLALAGLGIYLVTGRGSGGTPAAAPSTPASPPSSTAEGAPPSVVPTTANPLPTAGADQIYQWLPFSAADLSAAAQTTQAFAKAYSNWSYTETKAAYAAKLSGLVTAQESAILQDDYMTPGVAGPRTADKQVSTGKGTINSIKSFGATPTSPDTIVFLVTIDEQVTSTQPTKTQNSQYAVTVASGGGGTWQVSDIELAKLGNS